MALRKILLFEGKVRCKGELSGSLFSYSPDPNEIT
jgi:hypothetical protein